MNEETVIPRTPRAEENLKGKEDGERVRRRKLTARAFREKRQRGLAGKNMNIIASLGARTLGAEFLARVHKEDSLQDCLMQREDSELNWKDTTIPPRSPSLVQLASSLSFRGPFSRTNLMPIRAV